MARSDLEVPRGERQQVGPWGYLLAYRAARKINMDIVERPKDGTAAGRQRTAPPRDMELHDANDALHEQMMNLSRNNSQ
eukprot:3327568-Pyramimonas_sp.AAC.1